MASDSYGETSGPGHSISDIGSSGSDFASFRSLSEHDRQAIASIIESKYRIKLAQDQAREDLKVVAEKLGMKSSELNRIITLAMQERERGNVLMHEKALIEVAEQVVFAPTAQQ
jgi:hypothetical protein